MFYTNIFWISNNTSLDAYLVQDWACFVVNLYISPDQLFCQIQCQYQSESLSDVCGRKWIPIKDNLYVNVIIDKLLQNQFSLIQNAFKIPNFVFYMSAKSWTKSPKSYNTHCSSELID